MTKDSWRSENCLGLAADEGWSYESLGDTASEFKNHLVPERAKLPRSDATWLSPPSFESHSRSRWWSCPGR